MQEPITVEGIEGHRVKIPELHNLCVLQCPLWSSFCQEKEAWPQRDRILMWQDSRSAFISRPGAMMTNARWIVAVVFLFLAPSLIAQAGLPQADVEKRVESILGRMTLGGEDKDHRPDARLLHTPHRAVGDYLLAHVRRPARIALLWTHDGVSRRHRRGSHLEYGPGASIWRLYGQGCAAREE